MSQKRVWRFACRELLLSLIAGAFISVNVSGQDDHSHMQMNTVCRWEQMNPASMFLMDLSSGTAMNPQAWPMPMVMKSFGSWKAMFMGEGFIVDTQQSGSRGRDKLYSLNWLMSNFEHRLGEKGAFQAQLMLSLEPATITGRRYPLLFQTGETAFGKPIVDGQHPHNFIMGLGFQYARALGDNAMLELIFRTGGRSGARASGLPAPCIRSGAAASDLIASLAGFNAYRGRGGNGGYRI